MGLRRVVAPELKRGSGLGGDWWVGAETKELEGDRKDGWDCGGGLGGSSGVGGTELCNSTTSGRWSCCGTD